MSKSLASVFTLSKDTTVPEERVPLAKGALDTDFYNAVVNYAYLTESANGAVGVVVSLNLDVQGNSVPKSETFWITNRKRENYYMDRSSGKKMVMPSYTTIDELYSIVTGQPLSEVEADIEQRTIKVYDYAQKSDVPTQVEVITTLVNKPIGVLVQKVLKNKSAKQADGTYVDTAESFETNIITKFVNPETKATLNEMIHKIDEPNYVKAWLDQNQGKVRDTRTVKEAGTTTTANSAAPSQTSSSSTRKSLFD